MSTELFLQYVHIQNTGLTNIHERVLPVLRFIYIYMTKVYIILRYYYIVALQ